MPGREEKFVQHKWETGRVPPHPHSKEIAIPVFSRYVGGLTHKYSSQCFASLCFFGGGGDEMINCRLDSPACLSGSSTRHLRIVYGRRRSVQPDDRSLFSFDLRSADSARLCLRVRRL